MCQRTNMPEAHGLSIKVQDWHPTSKWCLGYVGHLLLGQLVDTATVKQCQVSGLVHGYNISACHAPIPVTRGAHVHARRKANAVTPPLTFISTVSCVHDR